jgi:hypothetical protein
MLNYMEAPPSRETNSILKPTPSDLFTVLPYLTVFELFAHIWFGLQRGAPSRDNNFIWKRPWHSISGFVDSFLLSAAISELFATFHPLLRRVCATSFDELNGVTDRMRRHQSTERPWYSISNQ